MYNVKIFQSYLLQIIICHPVIYTNILIQIKNDHSTNLLAFKLYSSLRVF